MEVILRPWKRFIDFRGRSSRTEFWVFHLIVWIALIALALLPMIATSLLGDGVTFILWFLPCMLLMLAAIIPAIAVGVRRVQDFDKAGGLYVIAIIMPIVLPPFGLIAMLIAGLIPGTKGANTYGPDPRDDQPGLEEAARRIFG